MSLLSTQAASRNYAMRPADERYGSVAELVQAAQHERNLSRERPYNMKDLTIAPIDGDLMMTSPKGQAKMTHWAFGQFCRMVDAPAQYMRELSPELAAKCLNYGIEQTVPGTMASLLVKAPNGTPYPVVRACTSDSYARVWDSELYGAVANQIIGQDDKWTLPPTWSGELAGAYRGDRDSFLILVNGGSIVNDPSARFTGATPVRRDAGTSAIPDNGMFRGLLIRNSEVGASSITIESILYRYVCGNHMLWGAVSDKTFRRRHVGTRVVRDAIREISNFAYNYVRQSTGRDEAIIRTLIDSEIAHTKEAVVDELRAMGATKDQAESAYLSCEKTESASPRSFWGAAQGLTRVSQESAWQSDRFVLDQLAGKVLARGAKLVRV